MIDRRLAVVAAALLFAAIAAVVWSLLANDQDAIDAKGPPDVTANAAVTAAKTEVAPQPAARIARELALGGVVLLPDGRGAAGATVTLYRQTSAWPEWRRETVESVVTGASGAFAFATARAPGFLVGFEHPDFAGDLKEAPPSLDELVLHLQPGYDVDGLVTNDAGLPMANVRVSLESTLVDERIVRADDTSTSGRFRFRNVPMGTVRVVARHEWWQPAALSNVVVGSFARSLELRFTRPALAVEGRVMSATTQEPVAGAVVLALPPVNRFGRNEPSRAISGPDGSFRLAGLARGVLRFEVRHPDHGVVARTVAVGSGFAAQVFDLPARGTVRGRLLAEDPSLVRGAVLTLRSAVDELVTAEVAADGAFAFERTVTPGPASLSATDGRIAFASGSSVATIRVEEQSQSFELAVGAPAVVTGRVVDEQGAPVAGARITATATGQLLDRLSRAGSALLDRNIGKLGDQLTRSAAGEPEPLLAVTDADGSFRVRGLPPGTVALRVARAGYGTTQQQVEVPACGQSAAAKDLVLRAGCRVRGRVQRGDRPLAGVQVGVVVDGMAITSITGLDGAYELTDLPQGDYRVSARYATFPSVKSKDIARARPGAPVVVDVELPPGRTVRGSVTGVDGQPVEGALVWLRGEQANPVLTDSNGAFEIEAPNREIELVVGQSERSARKVVPVPFGQERVVVSIDAVPNCTVTARVLGLPGRRALSGVLLRVANDRAAEASSSRWFDLEAGSLRHPLFPAGKSKVVFWAEGHAPVAREIELQAGEEHDFGEILLEPGCTLNGLVADERGEPVVGAEVFLGEEADLLEYQARTRSLEGGRFALRGVSSLASTLLVRAPGFAWKVVTLRLPDDVLGEQPFVVRLERGSAIEVEFGGRDAEGAMLVLRRDGRVVATSEVDENGIAVFANRAPGDYVVQPFGEELQKVSVTVRGSGEVVRCKL